MPSTSWKTLAVLPLLVGCGIFGRVNEDNFNEKYAEATCDLLKECFLFQYEGAYDADKAECLDDQLDQREDLDDLYDGCDFDDAAAGNCIDSLESAACGDFYELDDAADVLEDCERVWDCD